jgi:hypothetical protein
LHDPAGRCVHVSDQALLFSGKSREKRTAIAKEVT